MLDKLRKAYELGREYLRVTENRDLPIVINAYDDGNNITYKDYRDRRLCEKEIAGKTVDLGHLEKIAFNLGRKEKPEDLPQWKRTRIARKKIFHKLVEQGLHQALKEWFNKASANYLSDSEDNNGAYGGYVKDWSLGLTEDDLLEASVSYRVDDEITAEKDFITLFAKHGFERISIPHLVQHNRFGEPIKGLYFFST